MLIFQGGIDMENKTDKTIDAINKRSLPQDFTAQVILKKKISRESTEKLTGQNIQKKERLFRSDAKWHIADG